MMGGLWPEPHQFRPVEQNLWRQIGGKAQIAFRTDASGGSDSHVLRLPAVHADRACVLV